VAMVKKEEITTRGTESYSDNHKQMAV